MIATPSQAETEIRIPRALRAIGPGVVFALTVLGPGDFVSNAVTGATHGYALLWALAISVMFRFIWLDASARYVLATGETLMDGYRRLSPALVWLVFGALVVIRTLSNLYKVVLLGNTAELLMPLGFAGARYVWGAACCTTVYLVCVRGQYKGLERLFKLLVGLMCASLVLAVCLSNPDPGAILRGLTVPLVPDDRGHYGTLFLMLALIGTEAGSLTNVTYSYFLRKKGWRSPEFRKQQQGDLWFSVVCLFAMGAFVQIASAGILRPAGLIPSTADDLVALFSQTLGAAGRVIFTFGICAAAVSGFIGGTTGYSLVASDIWSRMRSSQSEQGKQDGYFNRFAAFWCFAPLPLLYLTDKPVWLVLTVSALMAMLIPVLATALLRLSSDQVRLRNLAAPWLIRAGLVVLIAASTVLIVLNIIQWGTGWTPGGA